MVFHTGTRRSFGGKQKKAREPPKNPRTSARGPRTFESKSKNRHPAGSLQEATIHFRRAVFAIYASRVGLPTIDYPENHACDRAQEMRRYLQTASGRG